MTLIDNEGRFFGLVNVIDALVVLFVLAVVVAGVTFLDPLGAGAQETVRYATVDLGTQPRYVAELIQEGDVMAPAGTDNNITVTDVHLSPTEDGDISVTLRTEIQGEVVDSDQRTGRVFSFAGTEIRQGDSLEIATDDYVVSGGVTELDDGPPGLSTETLPVVIEMTVPIRTAEEIIAGDESVVVGRTVATVESVTAYPAGGPTQRHLVVGASLATIRSSGRQRYAGVPVQLGVTVPLVIDGYTVNGTITDTGTTAPPGEPTTQTIEVKLENVQPEFANGLSPGLTETVRDTTYAEVTDVQVRPAVVTLTSEGGDIFRREHPVNKAVTLTVRVRARETPSGLTFHGGPLRQGQSVTFDFRTATVKGTVIGIGA